MEVSYRLIIKPNPTLPCYLSFTFVFVLQLAFLFGAVLGIAACVWIRFGSGVNYVKYEIYPVATLLGECSSHTGPTVIPLCVHAC